MENDFLVVHKSILPDCYMKVISARKLIESGKCKDISQAVKQVGISRSTYYKYSKYVFEASELTGGHTAIISLMLRNETGILGQLLSILSSEGCSVITINQGLPVSGLASVILTVDTSKMEGNIKKLLDKIGLLEGAESIKLMAIE